MRTRGDSGREQDEFRADRPSRTVTGKSNSWTLHTNRGQDEGGGRQTVTTERPAPVVSTKASTQWQVETDDATIRVTLDELAALQGMPAGFPFQGNRTSVGKQIGNLVCPTLAEAIVRTLTSDP